jgi:hypothetical protein
MEDHDCTLIADRAHCSSKAASLSTNRALGVD